MTRPIATALLEQPLLTRYPALAGVLGQPMPELACDLPTPLTQCGAYPGQLWVKRDDQTGAGYGGNKTRKLAFVLPHARAAGARRIVTVGGLGTHHGLATAVACRRVGLDCEVLLFDQPVTAHVRDNLRHMAYHGARLRFLGPMPVALAGWAADPRRLRRGNYYLFAGASNPVGVMAYVNAALELDAQLTAGTMPEPAAIYCAVGSTGTLAGLTLGMALAGRNIEVRGVRVIGSYVGPFAACTPATVMRLMRRTLAWMRATAPELSAVEPPTPILLDDWFGDGYGVPTAAGERAQALAAEQGLDLDATYTAKAFAAALEGAKMSSGPVLFWHTLAPQGRSETAAGDEVALPLAVARRLAQARGLWNL